MLLFCRNRNFEHILDDNRYMDHHDTLASTYMSQLRLVPCIQHLLHMVLDYKVV
jgi:hypothetical protein